MTRQCTTRFPWRAWLAALCLGSLAAGCTTVPTTPPVDLAALRTQVDGAVANGDLQTAIDVLARLATLSTGSARSEFQLEAAALEITRQNFAAATALLTAARAGAERGQQVQGEALFAEIDLAEGRVATALERIGAVLPEAVDSNRLLGLSVQGRALFQLGRPQQAVAALAERELWLDDAPAIAANQRLIWNNLQALPAVELRDSADATVDGWLTLIPVARLSDPARQRQALIEWRATHRGHPAAAVLVRELAGADFTTRAPRQVALLLPLSSAVRDEALAIRDGFIAAQSESSMTLRVYDTTREGAVAAYLRAQVEGAEFVVGPLLRDEVDAVLEQSGLVPTLTLNFSQSPPEDALNSFQFALAPEDEAVSIARHAIAEGRLRAVALVPGNDRGYRILDRFRETYEALGGELLAFSGYEPSTQNFSARIASLMNLDRSEQRRQQIVSSLREDLTFEPRRRQDIDLVFLASNTNDGRLIAPQLQYYYAGDIPTYSISEIYDTRSRVQDRDLDRIIFPEMPWLIAPSAQSAALRAAIGRVWPERLAAVPRFFAMGIDAFNILNSLVTTGQVLNVAGVTGELAMDTGGRVHRALPLAQIRAGAAMLISPPPAPAGGDIP